MDRADAPAARRGLQFSLVTALLLVTIAALGVGLWRAGQVVVPLQQQVTRLKSKAGELEITEPLRAAAINLPAYDELTWRWRIFVPVSMQYAIRARCNRIPAHFHLEELNSLPSFEAIPAVYLEQGEYVVTARIREI
jgi:hypothetical protein